MTDPMTPPPFRLGVVLEMIKFQHTFFALPFAAMSAALAAAQRSEIPWGAYGWILVAMVSARSSAMAFNRLVDRDIDRLNPRTSRRALPLGLVTSRQVALFTLVCALVFMGSAYALNPLAFRLSPLALAIILGYSYTKRFTWLSHWVLGISLAIAPVGAWIAIAGTIGAPSIVLAVAVTLWTAGFDMIYACQDVDFDRQNQLHSVPKKFGVESALRLSSALHVLTVVCLATLIPLGALGFIYALGIAGTALLLIYEHRLVRPDDLSRVDAAFFTTNAAVSLGLMTFMIADLAFRRAPG